MTKQLAVHTSNSNAAGSITAIARPPRGRASWSGLLQFSLLVVPVKAYPVVSTTETIQFNQLHADCGERIRYEKHCPSHGKVEASSIVRGYQYAPDQYVLIETSELDKLRPAKDKALQLEQFVDADQIDPAMFSGRSLYLFPDGLPAHRSYLVLAQAMQKRNCWAVGRVVMSGQRQLVLVRPAGRLLSMHVLHQPRQVRAAASWEADLSDGAGTEEELQLADMLIDAARRPLDWSDYPDDTAQQLTALVEAKIAGQPLVAPAEEPAQVLQLLDALKQSVASASGKPKRRKWRRPA